MKINWKLRFQNKAILTALVGLVIAFVYQLLGILGIVPSVSEDTIVNLVGLIINILVALGVVIDPTTEGVADSNNAMMYTEPKKEEETDGI